MKKRLLVILAVAVIVGVGCVLLTRDLPKVLTWVQKKGIPLPHSMATMTMIDAAANPPVTIAVDVQQDLHAIDPNIYGVNNADSNTLNQLNSPLNRYGGNRTTRYNWQQNTDSTAMDWYYQSYPDANVPGGLADNIVQNSHNAQAQPMITIPMIDWIAKAGAGRSVLWSFSIQKYGPQQGSDAEWYPDAGNGIKQDGTYVVGNDPNDANVPNSTAFEQTFVNHLVGKWGTAAQGGVRYYVMDNEHGIWYDTHRDVHPVGASMDEIRDKMIAYAEMIRSTEPNALIVGPEEYGWTGFFMSGYDKQQCEQKQAQGDFSCWGNPPERANHGGMLYMDWLLDQLHKHDVASGHKMLDVFTLHWYPQGPEYSDDVSTATQLLRNRSTRSLWDPNYTDETDWIADKVQLIPRMKNWVNTYYPGLKIGITEYGWGAENHINGATAQADVLGIFGREGLDLATMFTDNSIDPNSFLGKAFRMYRNYDGNKSAFGDTSVQTVAPDPDNVSAFGAVRGGDGALTVMVISKYLGNNTTVTIQMNNFQSTGNAQVWQLTSAGAITNLPAIQFGGAGFDATVPPRSITLFVIPTANQNPDYAISCAPSTLNANPGNPAQTNCTLNSLGGYNSSVTLSCSGLPAGATCDFSTNPVVVTGSTNVTVQQNVAAGDYPFSIDATDGAINHSFGATLHVNPLAQILFQDDFGDGIQSWTVHKGSWSETGGNLINQTITKSEIIAPPVFQGCSICTVEADLSVNAPAGSPSLLAWYTSSTSTLELMQVTKKNTWQLTHKMSGVIKSATVALPIQVGATNHVKITFDGQNFQLAINGVTVIPAFQPAGPPQGTVGFRLKSAKKASVTGQFASISVYQ